MGNSQKSINTFGLICIYITLLRFWYMVYTIGLQWIHITCFIIITHSVRFCLHHRQHGMDISQAIDCSKANFHLLFTNLTMGPWSQIYLYKLFICAIYPVQNLLRTIILPVWIFHAFSFLCLNYSLAWSKISIWGSKLHDNIVFTRTYGFITHNTVNINFMIVLVLTLMLNHYFVRSLKTHSQQIFQ